MQVNTITFFKVQVISSATFSFYLFLYLFVLVLFKDTLNTHLLAKLNIPFIPDYTHYTELLYRAARFKRRSGDRLLWKASNKIF